MASSTCDRCPRPYHGDRASWEGRLCRRCLRAKRSGHKATFGTFHHAHREDRGHNLLPPAHNARALELERAPFVPMDHFAGEPK